MKNIIRLMKWRLILIWIFTAVFGTAVFIAIFFRKWKRESIFIKQGDDKYTI